jgi:hypothetical protein
MNKTLLAVICIVPIMVLLPACSGDEQAQAKRKTPYDAQLKALEKAKQVDKLIQDADAKRRKEMEEQGI